MNTKIKKTVNELIKNKKSPFIIEIGSHYGEDTKDIMKVFNNPYICCFEPHHGNAAFMKKHFGLENCSNKKNPFCDKTYQKLDPSGNIFLYELAISNACGVSEFNALSTEVNDIPDKYKWIDAKDYKGFRLNDSGGSSLKGGYRDEESKKVLVTTVSIDEWSLSCSPCNEVDFIWMDVQGAEREVVEGGREVLGRTKYVWTEFGETFYEGGMSKGETIDLFASLDFRPLQSDRNNLLMENAK